MGQNEDEFFYPIFIFRKKKIILILRRNMCQMFVLSSFLLGNGYILVPVPTFFLFQYQLINFYEIKKL